MSVNIIYTACSVLYPANRHVSDSPIVIRHPTAYYRLHGRVVKGVGQLGHEEAMETGGREFDPRPGHYSRMSF